MAIATAPTQQQDRGDAIGRVIQITGPVVDIEFPPGKLPGI